VCRLFEQCCNETSATVTDRRFPTIDLDIRDLCAVQIVDEKVAKSSVGHKLVKFCAGLSAPQWIPTTSNRENRHHRPIHPFHRFTRRFLHLHRYGKPGGGFSLIRASNEYSEPVEDFLQKPIQVWAKGTTWVDQAHESYVVSRLNVLMVVRFYLRRRWRPRFSKLFALTLPSPSWVGSKRGSSKQLEGTNQRVSTARVRQCNGIITSTDNSVQ
jgi:hypothetical protein